MTDINSHEGRKYLRKIRSATSGDVIEVDVYCVLKAFGVTCPARQHAIKKLLCCGNRGKGDEVADLKGVIAAVSCAIELTEGSGEALAQDMMEVEKYAAKWLGIDAKKGPTQDAQEAGKIRGIVHFAPNPFVALCGADVPNQSTTGLRDHTTCENCKAVLNRLADDARIRQKQLSTLRSMNDHLAAIAKVNTPVMSDPDAVGPPKYRVPPYSTGHAGTARSHHGYFVNDSTHTMYDIADVVEAFDNYVETEWHGHGPLSAAKDLPNDCFLFSELKLSRAQADYAINAYRQWKANNKEFKRSADY